MHFKLNPNKNNMVSWPVYAVGTCTYVFTVCELDKV